jgi:serine/threonine protein kinase
MTTTSEHTGTARYLAPELVASDITVYPTLASDVYALGCLGLDVRFGRLAQHKLMDTSSSVHLSSTAILKSP